MKTQFLGYGLLGFMILGCGTDGPEIATVEGTVTMDGQPLANASVIFSPENGRPAAARTDESGHFELKFSGGREGAIPGKHTVQIRTARQGVMNDDGSMAAGSAETVPMVYNERTELEFVVEPDRANVADFKLESGGAVVEVDPDDR